MKKRIALLAAMLFLLAGCAETIEGAWAQEVAVSVLGTNVEGQTEVNAIQRFQFNADGTGTMTTDAGEDYPVADVAFRYALGEDTLTLTRGDGSETFTVTLAKDSLKLNSDRIQFDLKRVD